LKASLEEVLGESSHDVRIFKNARSASVPTADQLKIKRSSVFQKNVDAESTANFKAPVFEKSPADKLKIIELFQESFLTKNLDMKDLLTLADAMYAKHFNKGENIIRFGDIGSEYFILSSGVVNVTVYLAGSNPFDPKLAEKITVVKELSSEPKMIGFGEIALLMNDRRTASVTASSQHGCDTWVLAADVFKHIIASNTLRRRNINLTYLSQVQLFKNID